VINPLINSYFEHNSKLGKVSAAKIYELLKYNKEENMGMSLMNYK